MHTFRITHSSKGDGFDWWGEPCTVEVEAWNLHDALIKAAELPFDVLMADLFKDEDE